MADAIWIKLNSALQIYDFTQNLIFKRWQEIAFTCSSLFHCTSMDLWNNTSLVALNHWIPHFLITLTDFVIKYTVKSPSINILGTARSTCMLLLDRKHKVIPRALAYYKFSNFRYFSYLELWIIKKKYTIAPHLAETFGLGAKLVLLDNG